MTIFDKIKTMNREQIADWLDKCGAFDGSPWTEWFDKKYCKNCPSENVYVEYFNSYADCAWCELNYKCKFFPDMKDIPSNKDIIKMWLETEYEDICSK